MLKPTDEDGKRFVLLRVLPFASVPHICRRSYETILEQAAIYVRTDNAETAKVPTAEHMRRIIDRAVSNQGSALLQQIRRIVGNPLSAAPPVDEERFRAELREDEAQ